MKAFAAAAAACLFLGMPSTECAAAGDDIYARPGQLVSVKGTRLNLYCLGTGSPAVVFDSGWEDWAPVWTIVQAQVANWTRACSYDRAGAGFSDAGPMPRTSVRIADELHNALHKRRRQGALYSGRARFRRRQRAHVCGPVHGRSCGARAGRG